MRSLLSPNWREAEILSFGLLFSFVAGVLISYEVFILIRSTQLHKVKDMLSI